MNENPDAPDLSQLSDGDIGLAPVTKPLSPQAIRRIGALQVEDIQDATLDVFLESQRVVYEQTSKADLIETLLERDRTLALEGRQLASGVTGGRLLREFVRGVLAAADRQDFSKTERLERILQALGAEPAEARQLRLHGHTLGVEAEMVKQRVEDLANDALKE